LFPLRYYIHYNVCICCYYLCILLYRYLSLSFCCLLCLNYCLVTHKCCRHRLLSLNMCMSLTHGGDDEHHNNTPSSQHILLYPYLSLSFVHCPAFVFAFKLFKNSVCCCCCGSVEIPPFAYRHIDLCMCMYTYLMLLLLFVNGFFSFLLI